MLGLLGLMGLVAAGLVADAVMGAGDDPDLADDPDQNSAGDEADAQAFGTYGDDQGVNLVLAEASLAGDLNDEVGPVSERHDLAQRVGQDDGMPLSDDLPAAPDVPVLLSGTAGDDVLNGTGAADTLRGGDGHDILSGGAGDDRLSGGAGADVLDGADGADRLRGGDDADWLRGGAGDDLLWGNAGDDRIDGWEGDDVLAGGSGSDRMNGGEGADLLRGGDGGDWLQGGSGDDRLFGGAGDDEIDGGAGNDLIVGGSGADMLNGGDGDDSLQGGGYLSGGFGMDEFRLGPDGYAVVTDFAAGADRLVVVFDPDLHPDPAVTVTGEGSDAIIRLDGIVIAQVTGGAGLSAAEIVLRSA